MRRSEPSAVSKLFATHPMDSDRIAQTEKEIGAILPAKPEYIVTTSGYKDMRDRLLKLDARKKPSDPAKPQLRRAPDAPIDPQADDARPTLKRK